MDCEAYALFWKRLVKTEVNFFSLELKNQGRRRFIPALKDRVFAPSAEINRTKSTAELNWPTAGLL